MIPKTFPRRLNAPQIIASGFLGMILIGSLMLYLPISCKTGRVGFLDALFTATSATCVTGLVTVDTGTTYSTFGQVIILLLIQLGGLGYMTSSTLVLLLARRTVTLRGRVLLKEAHGQYSLQGVVRLTRYALIFTFSAEAVGAFLLALRFAFVPEIGPRKAVFLGVFHSVSAFCNSGFDLLGPIYGPFSSFVRFVGDLPVNLILAVLIIAGGIGFPVAMDLTNLRRHRLLLHTKVVLITTAFLLVLGTAVIAAAEWTNPGTLGQHPWPTKLLASFFQSVTPRTAGYNTIPISELHGPTMFFIGLLMFIGASPGGTGGGVKTTTVALMLAAVLAVLQNRSEAEMLGRRIPSEIVYRALAIFVLAFLWVNFALFAITFTEIQALKQAGITEDLFAKLFFEILSAFGTVGLSAGITPYLTPFGKIVIILTMYVGRVGPLTAALVFLQMTPRARRTLPEDKVLIG